MPTPATTISLATQTNNFEPPSGAALFIVSETEMIHSTGWGRNMTRCAQFGEETFENTNCVLVLSRKAKVRDWPNTIIVAIP